MIVLPFFGGVIADRMDRRLLLWITQSGQALLSLTLALLVALDLVLVWHIIVVMCLGAGDITGWAARLPEEMDALREAGS